MPHPRDAGSIRVGPHGQTNSVAIAAGSVWVSSHGGASKHFRVTRIDPNAHAIERRVHTMGGPTWDVGGGGMAFGEGSLWVVGSRELPRDHGTVGAAVNRLDLRTGVVTEIALRGSWGADVAVDRWGAWVATFQASGPALLQQVDPDSDVVRRRVRLQTDYVRRVVAVGGMIVVQEYRSGNGLKPLLESLDPRSGRVVSRSSDRRFAYEITQVLRSGTELWARTTNGAVRLDPRSLRPIGRVIPQSCCFLASSPKGIWLELEPRHTLALFDLKKRSVHRYPNLVAGAIAAVAGPHALWLLDYDGTLRKIALIRRA